jgi:hypothetical protein
MSIANVVALAMASVLAFLSVLGALSAWERFTEVSGGFRQASEVTFASARALDALALDAIFTAKRTMQENLAILWLESLEQGHAGEKRLADGRFLLGATVSKLEVLPHDPATELPWAEAQRASARGRSTPRPPMIDRVIQHNVGSADEASSAASELSAQAEELAGMVSTFQLSSVGEKRPPPARRAGQRNGEPSGLPRLAPT